MIEPKNRIYIFCFVQSCFGVSDRFRFKIMECMHAFMHSYDNSIFYRSKKNTRNIYTLPHHVGYCCSLESLTIHIISNKQKSVYTCVVLQMPIIFQDEQTELFSFVLSRIIASAGDKFLVQPFIVLYKAHIQLSNLDDP